MIEIDEINKILGVTEAYEAHEKLMAMLMDETKRAQLFGDFLQVESDLSYDWFTEYFQTEHGDRDKFKQDYTPKCLVNLLCGIAKGGQHYADICAGTGGLTIGIWNTNKNATFCCEEYSTRAIPFLLFNLSIRKIDAIVVHGDSLTRSRDHIYQVRDGEILEIDDIEKIPIDTVIMNPPYSMRWTPISDERFEAFGLAPASKADFAFLLHGLSITDARLFAILPHGILFRGNSEAVIRQRILEANLIDSIIGVPNHLFMYTDIPVLIISLDKHRERDEVLFIDAADEFVKMKKQNVMTDEQVEKIISVYRNRFAVERLSALADLKFIHENGYNLNIPRYVDKFIETPAESPLKLIQELQGMQAEIFEVEKQFYEMLRQLEGTNDEADEEINEIVKAYGGIIAQQPGQITFDDVILRSNKNE